MENKLKHLELVQGVINRITQCSFLIKGWTVALVSGLFALGAKDANILFVCLAYLPAIAFWYLDAYYLYQERLYRNLYNEVARKAEEAIDFNLNASEYAGKDKATLIDSILSKTILPFHGILVLTIMIVMVVLLVTKGSANG